ncbi:putative pentatricopeptide repeat-containing protein [Asimina triloba]
MIRAHSKGPHPHLGFHFYRWILDSDLVPDNYTFTFLVRTCAALPSSGAGPVVHGSVFRRGFGADAHVQSALIHMYAELGSHDAARRVFSEIDRPDLVIQTAMVGASAVRGDIEFARELFDEMPHRDLVAWNAMIAGYAQRGQSREALHLFGLMQTEGPRLNEVTLVSVLSACAHLGALDQGRWVHAYIERSKLQMTVVLGTALIDMYSKCGHVTKAVEVFWGMRERNVYTWSSLLNGLAVNGCGEQCLEMFDLMNKEGIAPNEVTFVSVLRGCSMAGLVDEGRKVFDLITRVYGLEPTLEHYGCMVDLHGRAGLLNEAFDVIKSMPVEPHVGAWGALLSACRLHRNLELGEFSLRKIVELERENDGAYVLLSNLYAHSRNWDGVSNIRELMKVTGVKKEPGCSAIEVGGQIHEFFAGDNTHPRYKEIKAMLGEMYRKLRLAGYVARTDQVLFDVEEEDKEDALYRHSEKVAIAFGLVSLEEGAAIRIVMNLRICSDCHDAIKIISKIFSREIVARDRNRFHHFKDGNCSCMDYW